MRIEFFVNQTANAESSQKTWLGGRMFLDIDGVPDGAEISLFLNAGNGKKTNADLTKNESGQYEVGFVPAASLISVSISGAGAATNLSIIAVNA